MTANTVQYMQKKKAGLAALGEWKHVNCLRPIIRDDIHDDILQHIFHHLPQGKPHSKSKLDRLLAAADIDNIERLDEVLTIRDVPGGTVSFLFEKSSTDSLQAP